MEKEYYFNAGTPPPLHFQPSPLQMPNNFNNFDKSTAHFSQFESALSSMTSSPAASNSATDVFAIRELIGKLGTICNPGEISPEFMPGKANYINGGGNNSPNTSSSCYNTPLGSPPKLQVPIMNHFVKESLGNSMHMNSGLLELPTDPGFAARAAKFSCFGSRSFNGRASQMGMNNGEYQYRSSGLLMGNGNLSRVASSPSLKAGGSPMSLQQENKNFVSDRKLSHLSVSGANSNEESSISGQNPSGENGVTTPSELNSRKRKGISRGKAKETVLLKEAEGDDDSSVKRSKMSSCNVKNNGGVKTEEATEREDQKEEGKNNQKLPEPPKDYIHVRARRGQATDSHSLAERVRREKIGERMKLLQDLVPGCNKVTGKALMLDEIINYVQSLQRQVEFLSMKLSTVNPRLDVNMDNILSKDVFQPKLTMPHQLYPVDASSSAYYGNQNSHLHKSVEPLDTTLCHNLVMPLDGFGESLAQDDLQSIVQMGLATNQTSHMKIEL